MSRRGLIARLRPLWEQTEGDGEAVRRRSNRRGPWWAELTHISHQQSATAWDPPALSTRAPYVIVMDAGLVPTFGREAGFDVLLVRL